MIGAGARLSSSVAQNQKPLVPSSPEAARSPEN